MGHCSSKHKHLARTGNSREVQPPHRSRSSNPPLSAAACPQDASPRTGHPPDAAAGPHSSHVILPLDLLPSLFDSALEELCTGRQRVHFALAVSHVSRDWRTMALLHSALWATIFIDEQLAGVQELVELFLFRAGTRPLDVIVHATGVKETLDAHVALRAVLAVSTRWRSLTFAWWCGKFLLDRILGTLHEHPMPQFEALHLSGQRGRHANIGWSVTVQLPALRSLRLSGVRLRYKSSLPPRSILSNLTVLELDEDTRMSSSSRVRDVVRETPKLQRLALGLFIPWVDPEGTDPVEPVSLPALRYFQVYIPGATIAKMFGDFTAPALEHLVLKPLSLKGWEGLQSFLGNSGKTFPSLRTLQICNMRGHERLSICEASTEMSDRLQPVPPSVMKGFCSAMPALKALILEDVDPAILQRGLGSAKWSHATLWTELTEVSICWAHISLLCGHTLVNLVSARKQVGRPLSTLRIQDTMLAAMDREVLEWLEGAVEIQSFSRPVTAPLGDADW